MSEGEKAEDKQGRKERSTKEWCLSQEKKRGV